MNPTSVPGAELTRREDQAMYLRSRGKQRREVATLMGISRPTVGNYFASAVVKLEADDIPHAIRIYLQRTT